MKFPGGPALDFGFYRHQDNDQLLMDALRYLESLGMWVALSLVVEKGAAGEPERFSELRHDQGSRFHVDDPSNIIGLELAGSPVERNYYVSLDYVTNDDETRKIDGRAIGIRFHGPNLENKSKKSKDWIWIEQTFLALCAAIDPDYGAYAFEISLPTPRAGPVDRMHLGGELRDNAYLSNRCIDGRVLEMLNRPNVTTMTLPSGLYFKSSYGSWILEFDDRHERSAAAQRLARHLRKTFFSDQ